MLNTSDSGNSLGRGAKAFDPYAGPASGAIRLSLQIVNGCAVIGSGEPVSKGGGTFPYPTTCSRPSFPAPTQPPPPMQLLTGTTYFLNQLTLMDYATNLHTSGDMTEVVNWMKTQTHFKGLDFSQMTVTSDSWVPSIDTFGPGYFKRQVVLDNAAWMLVKDDKFKIEVLDAGGEVRAVIEYDRSDLLGSSTAAGHSLFGWEADNLGAPLFPGDTAIHAGPALPTAFPPASAIVFRSIARFELIGSTRPTKSFVLPSTLKGDGAIRLTWSQLPDAPFYVPVRYVEPASLPLDCYSGTDPTQRTTCNFGVQPQVTLSVPKNGKFYTPGETFQATVAIKDGSGNYIHAPDHLPSYTEFMTDRANGLLYYSPYHRLVLHERDQMSGMNIAGPRQEMKPFYELGKAPFYLSPTDQYLPVGNGNTGMDFFVPAAVAHGSVPGFDIHPSTTYNFTLPADVKSGTYNFNFKVNRHYLGERLTKMSAFGFQVGQEEKTSYPNRVGNCQICHRGVLSLDNLRHGISVDHVEGCKACHTRDNLPGGRSNTLNFIHALHMNSRLYPLPKNDCTSCHLTRESTKRPSDLVCSSCHPQPHGGTFASLRTTPDSVPDAPATVYSNCAETCHGATAPSQHILPKD